MIIFRRLSFYLALAGMILAMALIQKLGNTEDDSPSFAEPARNPYEKTVAASGMVEATDKNIEIGVPQSGLVKNIYVKVWDKVTQGQPLFCLDNREQQAQLLVQKAHVMTARATLDRLRDQLHRLESIEDPRAVSQEELKTRRFDVEVAKAQVEVAEAQMTHTILLMECLVIQAPQDGVILQNNIRKGEFVVAGSPQPAMILGDIEHLQIRAEVDEQNASLIAPHMPATAFPKNNSQLAIPLNFERIEPYVIPKRSLTGASNERVDTRVLQVIYTFDKPSTFPLYVGQQVDVFIQQPDENTLAMEEIVEGLKVQEIEKEEEQKSLEEQTIDD